MARPSIKVVGREVFKIYGEFTVGTAAVTKAIDGKLCTINVLSGVVYINPFTTAVADGTSIKLTGSIDMVVDGDISLIGEVADNTVQIIVWG